MIMDICFWIFVFSLFIIFYSYFGYGLLIWGIVSVKKCTGFFKSKDSRLMRDSPEDLPEVTLVVAAYNEEEVIEAKVKNALQLNYPSDKLRILFVTDGSTDKTVAIIKKFPQIELLHSPERAGKTAALNRAMRRIHSPIAVFCDANTILCSEAILKIVSHYKDPKVGGVAGEKRVVPGSGENSKVANEGLYWRYESMLKRLDAQLHTVVGAAGELFSVRTSLWEDLEDKVILDDLLISMRINLKGFKIAYEPEAYAMEPPSDSISEEKKRKIRISAGAFQAMVLLKPVFNFVQYPVLFFQFFSHRVLRWTLTPLCLPLLFFSNAFLVLNDNGNLFFSVVFNLQLLVYLLSFIGRFSDSNKAWMAPARVCYYVLFMNYSVFIGFYRFMKGEQSAMWEKARRKVPSATS